MTQLAQTSVDPLTGLPVICVREAVCRVLGRGPDYRAAAAMRELLMGEVPAFSIAGVVFFSWSDFVDFLDGTATEGAT